MLYRAAEIRDFEAVRMLMHKVMLLTGVNRAARGFYRACGFSDREKIDMVIYRDRSGAAHWQKGDEE
jgi:hypothetical protein